MVCYQFFDQEIYSFGHSGIKDECNCLPACTSISYEAEYSQANFDFNGLLNVFRILYQNILKQNFTDDLKNEQG